MLTLGINAAFHDSSACLVEDGRVIAAAEDERFTRIKHGKRPVPFSAYELPFHAIDFCLKRRGVTLREINNIAYSFDPYLVLPADRQSIELPLEPSAVPVERQDADGPWYELFLSYVVNARRQLAGGSPHHLEKRFRGFKADGEFKWHNVSHHLAHAASAYLPSPFDDAAIMTLDGRGEKATTMYAHGSGVSIKPLNEVQMPHSLGLLYEKITSFLGFLHSSDEYKVMALASFGKPNFAEAFRDMIKTDGDGGYLVSLPRFEEVFGKRRHPGEKIEERHCDIAASLQRVLEETVLGLATWLKAKSGSRNLCLAGGVALNCVLNSVLRDSGIYEKTWVQPAAGDSGTALGAALWVDSQERRVSERCYEMKHVYLGPEYSDDEIEELLRWSKSTYRRSDDVIVETVDLLEGDQVIGWFQGRMEFGPRALGARSIVASPFSPRMQEILNDIKGREDFRPVAPSVPQDVAHEWFSPGDASPYMLFVDKVRGEVAHKIPETRQIDGTARIQTVTAVHNPLYFKLLKTFGKRTGVPVLINTSFNVRGEPIVCSPRDALECFWTSPLDALVIGPFIVKKGA